LNESQQGGAPSEEELRERLEEELKKVSVDDVLLQAVITLVNLGGRRLGIAEGTREARLGSARKRYLRAYRDRPRAQVRCGNCRARASSCARTSIDCASLFSGCGSRRAVDRKSDGRPAGFGGEGAEPSLSAKHVLFPRTGDMNPRQRRACERVL